jgi:curved DNA-binding protein CbpA
MPEPPDAYKVLQVDSEAEDEVIQAAYRRLARKYHPDAAGDDATAAARMSALNAAWELIGNPVGRAAYDQSRRTAAAAPTPGPRPSTTGASEPPRSSPAPHAAPRPPETVSRDWTPGRSTFGGGFDDSMRAPEGLGGAGPPPGRPSGSVVTFGRYNGWSLGEIARGDLDYIEWLDRMPIGRPYRDEIDAILRASGRRRSANAESTERRGLFRRR